MITRGFRRRRTEDDERLPPGQYLEHGFPVLSAGPTPRTPLDQWDFALTGSIDQDRRWTWDEFQANAQKLTKGGTYGVAWALKSPTNRVMNLSLNFDGKFFYTDGGKTEVRIGDAEKEIPRRIHDMIYVSKTASPDAVGMGGTDPLPGFFAGKYAMLPGGVYLR